MTSRTRPVGLPGDVLADLSRDLRRFADAAASASLTVDDHPTGDIPSAVEACIDAIGDLHVFTHELLENLGSVAGDGRAVRTHLIAAHEGVNRLREPLKKATSPESVTRLRDLGQSRRRDWQLWVTAMRQALDQLDAAFAPLDDRLLACWKAVSLAIDGA